MYYPIVLQLEGKKIVIIGGGSIASRKLKSVLDKETNIFVVSKSFCDEIMETAYKNENIDLVYGEYRDEYIKDADMVIAATDDRALNERICEYSKVHKILCANASDYKNGDFIMPSVFRRGDFIASFTTCGASPSLCKQAKDMMEERYPEDFDSYVRILGEIRTLVLKRNLSAKEKKSKLNSLIKLSYKELVNIKKELEDETHTWN